MKKARYLTMKMPLPSDKALAVGKKMLSVFAHHAPAPERPIARMERPRGGKGPKI